MNIENLIAYFLALKDNIILQRNDLLQQNRDISKKLLEITSKIDSLAKKNEELTSHVSVAQNASKILQEALKTASSKLVELERQHHKLEQYTRRECLDFSGIPNSVAPKHLENFILRLLQKIGISFDKLRIVACHRLENTVRTIVKLLNWKDAENVYSNRKKLKDVDISCLVSDDDIQGRNDMTTGSQNDWREGGLSRKRKIFESQNLCSYYRYLYGLFKEKKAEGLTFLFLGLQRNHLYEGVAAFTCNYYFKWIWYLILFGNFFHKTSLLGSFAFFYRRFMICDIFFS